MQQLTLDQTAAYLDAATIDRTYDAGHAIIHVGKNAAGAEFVLVNDCHGNTSVSESM